jgi:GGDEF domain-containing protein
VGSVSKQDQRSAALILRVILAWRLGRTPLALELAAHADWSLVGLDGLRPTVSIGVARDLHDLDGLFILADAAPYRTKHLGRNRVELHTG